MWGPSHITSYRWETSPELRSELVIKLGQELICEELQEAKIRVCECGRDQVMGL